MPADFDPSPLRDIETLGGAALVARITAAFMRGTPERIESAYRASLARQAEPIRFAMHALKSSAASIGARSLQRLAEEVEFYAHRGDFTPLPLLIQELQGVYADTVAWLEGEGYKKS